MARRLVATEPGGQILSPVFALGQLTLVDEVDSGLPLLFDDLGNCLAETVVVDVGFRPHVVWCRQRADVCRENPVRASSHVAEITSRVQRSRSAATVSMVWRISSTGTGTWGVSVGASGRGRTTTLSTPSCAYRSAVARSNEPAGMIVNSSGPSSPGRPICSVSVAITLRMSRTDSGVVL